MWGIEQILILQNFMVKFIAQTLMKELFYQMMNSNISQGSLTRKILMNYQDMA